jgi:hypothetical protein
MAFYKIMATTPEEDWVRLLGLPLQFKCTFSEFGKDTIPSSASHLIGCGEKMAYADGHTIHLNGVGLRSSETWRVEQKPDLLSLNSDYLVSIQNRKGSIYAITTKTWSFFQLEGAPYTAAMGQNGAYLYALTSKGLEVLSLKSGEKKALYSGSSLKSDLVVNESGTLAAFCDEQGIRIVHGDPKLPEYYLPNLSNATLVGIIQHNRLVVLGGEKGNKVYVIACDNPLDQRVYQAAIDSESKWALLPHQCVLAITSSDHLKPHVTFLNLKSGQYEARALPKPAAHLIVSGNVLGVKLANTQTLNLYHVDAALVFSSNGPSSYQRELLLTFMKVIVEGHALSFPTIQRMFTLLECFPDFRYPYTLACIWKRIHPEHADQLAEMVKTAVERGIQNFLMPKGIKAEQAAAVMADFKIFLDKIHGDGMLGPGIVGIRNKYYLDNLAETQGVFADERFTSLQAKVESLANQVRVNTDNIARIADSLRHLQSEISHQRNVRIFCGVVSTSLFLFGGPILASMIELLDLSSYSDIAAHLQLSSWVEVPVETDRKADFKTELKQKLIEKGRFVVEDSLKLERSLDDTLEIWSENTLALANPNPSGQTKAMGVFDAPTGVELLPVEATPFPEPPPVIEKSLGFQVAVSASLFAAVTAGKVQQTYQMLSEMPYDPVHFNILLTAIHNRQGNE